MRARYRQVTNFVFDVMHRDQDDWRWDPSLVDRPKIRPRRGATSISAPCVPQLVASMRAGTLIAENVDVYLRGAAAADLSKTGEREEHVRGAVSSRSAGRSRSDYAARSRSARAH